MKRISIAGLIVFLLLNLGCADLQKLRDENQRLAAEVADLEQRMAELADREGPPPPDLTKIRTFTVGLAAAQKDFDEGAFTQLLERGIAKAADGSSYRLVRENDPREMDKVRGMLLHQYLAAEEIPITIFNLSYKLSSSENEFLIGERAVPRSGVQIATASGGSAVHVNHKGPIPAIMRRDSRGNYSIAYHEDGSSPAWVRLRVADVEILDPNQGPQSARQGDISFNWRLNLEQLQVYRVEDFKGDVGRFLRTMRYPGPESTSISQYQTLRDSVFLFGYGNYFTSLVNQIKTPRHITAVEVMGIDSAAFEQLEAGLDEGDLLDIIGRSAQWQACTFVEYDGDDKVWSRPSAMSFPFHMVLGNICKWNIEENSLNIGNDHGHTSCSNLTSSVTVQSRTRLPFSAFANVALPITPCWVIS